MRRANDFYPTPAWATEHMIESVPFPLDRGIILEPCCGARDIVRPIQAINRAVFTCDIDRRHKPNLIADMTCRDSWWAATEMLNAKPDWVITNPPFNAAHHILPLALENCTRGVIALLRISYGEPCENRARHHCQCRALY